MNEAPTAITVDPGPLSVDENADGAVVTAIAAVDPDAGESFTWAVDDGRFEVAEIVPGSFVLKLKAGETLDHETEASVDVEVTATDSGGLSVTDTFTIAVNDVNEAPGGTGGLGTWSPDPVEQGLRRAPLAPEAGVVDPEGDTLSYELVTAPAAGRFFLGDTEVTVGMVLNEAEFEAMTFEAPETTGVVGAQFSVSDGVNTTPLTVSLTVSAPVDSLLTGTPGPDYLDGGAGNDTIAPLEGDDTVYGGSGIDTLDFSASTDAVTVGLANTAPQVVSASQGTDILIGFENVIGSDHDDFLYGDMGDNVLTGGDGNDRLAGGAGNDTMDGGGGFDALNYFSAAGGVTVDLRDEGVAQFVGGGQGTDTFTNIHNVIGSGFGDVIDGDGKFNQLFGFGGDDTLRGHSGNDTIRGGGGNDLIGGGDGNDLVIGEAGNDRLFGANGNDVFYGGAGDDTITGSGDGDLMFGGDGADVFRFVSVTDSTFNQRDIIADFVSGVDKLDFVDVDADAGVVGNQAFTFVGTAAFSAAGQLRFVTDGTNGWVQADVDGDANADMVMQLLGVTGLTVDDFLL